MKHKIDKVEDHMDAQQTTVYRKYNYLSHVEYSLVISFVAFEDFKKYAHDVITLNIFSY